jgi:tetratricopeptide (TPR) repeat protein
VSKAVALILAIACAGTAVVGTVREPALQDPDVWLHHDELQRGRFTRAAEFLKQPKPAPLAIIARHALETGDWDAAIALPDDPSDRDGVAAYARGVAAARAAWLRETPALLDTARAAASSLERRAARQGSQSLAELHRVCVLAATAAAQEERAELGVLLTHATSMVRRPGPARAPTNPIIPAHELAGDLWLQVSRFQDAARAFAIALERHPRRPRSLIGLARASARAGDVPRARAAYEEFLTVWNDADTDRPELSEAREYLAR